MDIKQPIDYQYEYLDVYNDTGIVKYNYTREGVLRKCLPKILFQGNGILVTFLQLIDVRIIMLMKYIDKLKTFKFISQYI